MEDILKGMDAEKRDRVINSAIDEFANFPYEKASTNNIVKNAGISKGLLFHYFGSKKDLYEKLVGFVITTLANKIIDQIDWDENDILQRIKQAVIFKMKLGQQYPKMFDFIINMLSNSGAKNVEDIMKVYEKHGINAAELLTDIYTRNIDYSKFKDQINIDKQINITMWTLEKYSEQYLKMAGDIKNFDYEKAAQDIDVYIDVLKKAFY